MVKDTLVFFKYLTQTRSNNERGTIVGLRNAHDKCFPAGLCAGDAPFVCDNLIFHNEVTLARRHTKNILNDLDQVISRTLGKLFGMWNKQDNRIEAYSEFELEDAQVNDLVVRSCKAGALPKSKIMDVVEQWHDSDHDEFSHRNMNSLYTDSPKSTRATSWLYQSVLSTTFCA